jgi:hypothetical protein
LPRAGCLKTGTSGSAIGVWGNTLVGRLEGAPCAYYNQLQVIHGDDDTQEAVEDWNYWVNRGYLF